ncbi:hypothetical protein K438DRAFT_1955570 [Mycena galopus ATCC 62051]|nr:hypothetical protein K438DRAFT_1955570 [Mycena galopus ATCC 62051]
MAIQVVIMRKQSGYHRFSIHVLANQYTPMERLRQSSLSLPSGLMIIPSSVSSAAPPQPQRKSVRLASRRNENMPSSSSLSSDSTKPFDIDKLSASPRREPASGRRSYALVVAPSPLVLVGHRHIHHRNSGATETLAPLTLPAPSPPE